MSKQSKQVAVAQPVITKVGAAGKAATGSGKPKAQVKASVSLKAPKAPAPKPSKDERTEARRAANAKAHEAIAQIPSTAPCACGCGEQVPVRRFRPGHDARLLSRLITEALEQAPAKPKATKAAA